MINSLLDAHYREQELLPERKQIDQHYAGDFQDIATELHETLKHHDIELLQAQEQATNDLPDLDQLLQMC